ncbi:hypothetical protein [Aquipuribacter hungaricus]|uniref:Uncharacterized protein n=1 Tax=Aquipuribacter hungaricus TaxID=545624 RepID=A0ABV7WP88_9MICO
MLADDNALSEAVLRDLILDQHIKPDAELVASLNATIARLRDSHGNRPVPVVREVLRRELDAMGLDGWVTDGDGFDGLVRRIVR